MMNQIGQHEGQHEARISCSSRDMEPGDVARTGNASPREKVRGTRLAAETYSRRASLGGPSIATARGYEGALGRPTRLYRPAWRSGQAVLESWDWQHAQFVP